MSNEFLFVLCIYGIYIVILNNLYHIIGTLGAADNGMNEIGLVEGGSDDIIAVEYRKENRK